MTYINNLNKLGIMRTVDRLKKYILDGLATGNLNPGDRLGSYMELTKICGGSYTTIHNAMSRLAREGLVRIEQGKGSFITGGETLTVNLDWDLNSISRKDLRGLLDRHIPADLNVRFNVQRNMDHLDYPEDEPVIQLTYALDRKQTSTCFEVLTEKDCSGLFDEQNTPFGIPYLMATFVIGVNSNLVRKTGITFRDDFLWWDEYVKKARELGFSPASSIFTKNRPFGVDRFLGLLWMLHEGSIHGITGPAPYFDTDAGHRFMKMMKDIHMVDNNNREQQTSEDFNQNNAGFTFAVGNWIAVQNKSPLFNSFWVDSLEILPYAFSGRRFYPYYLQWLQVRLSAKLDIEKKQRLEKVIRILKSREFLWDYCNLTGWLSLRNDIRPQDYSWNRTGCWDVFFPRPQDDMLSMDDFAPMYVKITLGMCLEFYRIHHSDPDFILKLMDVKKNFVNAFISPDYGGLHAEPENREKDF